MNELQIADIIEREFRAMRLPLPSGLTRATRNTPEGIVWLRVMRHLADECQSDNRRAARAASMAGAIVTRGRTRL